MNWRKTCQAIVLICIVFLVTSFFYPFSYPQQKGIFIEDEKYLVIRPEADSSPEVTLSFPPSYRFGKIAFVKDSILPEEQKGFVEETSVQIELLLPHESVPINAKVVIRTFRTGDVFLLLRLFSTEKINHLIQFTLAMQPIIGQEAEVWSLHYNDDIRPDESTVPNSDFTRYTLYTGRNVLAPSLYYLEMNQEDVIYGSILGGAGSVYEKTPTELSNLTTLEKMESQPIVDWNPSRSLTITSSLELDAYQTAESWFFISSGSLLDMYNNETYNNMRSADLNLRKKISQDGIFHVASERYYIGASDQRYDYYYNYAGWEGRRFMDLYKKYPEQRFFYDMFVNLVYTTAKAVSKYGNWPSSHGSVYLWESYQIPMNYIDTRYCTDAGFFLLKAYNDYQIPQALFAGKKFGDYLVALAKQDHKIHTKNGFFFYDYYHADLPNTTTHASLNHILSEMNYLFELYLCTHNEEFLSTAEKIVASIEDTETQWLRIDPGNYRFYHDLWYGVTLTKTGDFDFKKTGYDYTKTLTYEDLLKAQSLYHQIYYKDNEAFTRLLKYKKEFLDKEGHVTTKIISQ